MWNAFTEYICALVSHGWWFVGVSGYSVLNFFTAGFSNVKQKWTERSKFWWIPVFLGFAIVNFFAFKDMMDQRDTAMANVETQNQQAMREGRYYKPKYSVVFLMDLCEVTNKDVWDLAVVSITFRTRTIDTSNCMAIKQSWPIGNPGAVIPILPPSKSVSVIVPPGHREHLCAETKEIDSRTRNRFVQTISCDVVIHPSADRSKEYEEHRYNFVYYDDNDNCIFVGPNSLTVAGQSYDPNTKKPTRTWKIDKFRMAYDCLIKKIQPSQKKSENYSDSEIETILGR